MRENREWYTSRWFVYGFYYSGIFFSFKTHLIFKMLLKTINVIIIIMITAIQTTLEYVVRWLLAKNAGFFLPNQIKCIHVPPKYGSQLMLDVAIHYCYHHYLLLDGLNWIFILMIVGNQNAMNFYFWRPSIIFVLKISLNPNNNILFRPDKCYGKTDKHLRFFWMISFFFSQVFYQITTDCFKFRSFVKASMAIKSLNRSNNLKREI